MVKNKVAQPEVEIETCQAVCVGLRETANHRSAQFWQVIRDGKLTEETIGTKPQRGAFVGAVYQLTLVKGTKNYFTSGKNAPVYQRKWLIQKDIDDWERESDLITTRARMMTQIRKDKEQLENFAALADYRDFYRKLQTRQDRAAFLANVIAEITGRI